MFRKTFRQLCKKCKGTGTTQKILKDKDDQVIFAPVYHDPNDKRRPQMEVCTDCDYPGSGMQSYITPEEVVVDGERRKLEPQERMERFNDTAAA